MELGQDIIPLLTVVNCLKIMFNKPIAYENAFPMRYWVFLLEIQVNHVEYNCYRIHDGPSDVKEGGDTGYIRHIIGKF